MKSWLQDVDLEMYLKSYTPNQSEKVFANKHVNTVPWTYVISDLKGEENLGTFYKKEF